MIVPAIKQKSKEAYHEKGHQYLVIPASNAGRKLPAGKGCRL
jgi:hypothetical protein